MSRRPYVLGGVFLAIAALAAVILFEVLGTVFFALSVAYMLVPLRRRLRSRGFSRITATVSVTALAVAGFSHCSDRLHISSSFAYRNSARSLGRFQNLSGCRR